MYHLPLKAETTIPNLDILTDSGAVGPSFEHVEAAEWERHYPRQLRRIAHVKSFESSGRLRWVASPWGRVSGKRKSETPRHLYLGAVLRYGAGERELATITC